MIQYSESSNCYVQTDGQWICPNNYTTVNVVTNVTGSVNVTFIPQNFDNFYMSVSFGGKQCFEEAYII
jgi:hypothetical protein